MSNWNNFILLQNFFDPFKSFELFEPFEPFSFKIFLDFQAFNFKIFLDFQAYKNFARAFSLKTFKLFFLNDFFWSYLKKKKPTNPFSIEKHSTWLWKISLVRGPKSWTNISQFCHLYLKTTITNSSITITAKITIQYIFRSFFWYMAAFLICSSPSCTLILVFSML